MQKVTCKRSRAKGHVQKVTCKLPQSILRENFHQIFAECMEAGHLDNPRGPEISTGLLQIIPDTIDIPPWYSDPKFARFRVHKSGANGDKSESTNSASIQELL